MQPSLFTFERFVKRPKNFYYFIYDGFEYRFDKRSGTFVRADGSKFYRSETFTTNLRKAMDAQVKVETASTHKEKMEAIRKVKAARLSPEEHARRIEEYKQSKKKVTNVPYKSNEVSWANYYLRVKETKTRVTSTGVQIKIGNMIITVKDPAKVEEVRRRFEDHELNKYKRP